MHEKEIRKNGKLIVSVPYRGYSFFNEFQPDKIKIAVKFPSLTGVILFLIVLYITFENSLLKFPSLTGVIRFLMKKNYSYNIYDAVSVPYRGYSFFNWIFQNLRTLILTSKVSVPYRGYSFFNCGRLVYRYCGRGINVFPSLTGVIRFLIEKHARADDKTVYVSVPYRGYSFFNPTLESPHGYWAQNTFCGAKLFLIGNY